jgi:hypothetical protein
MGLFGEEKIFLTLEKYNYTPGELIKGNIKLNLRKPTTARKLEVSFIGQRKEQRRDSKGHTHTTVIRVFNFTVPLKYEGDYMNEQFDFEIKIPDNLLNQTVSPKTPELDGTLGKLVTIGIALSGQRSYPIQWLVEAHLDVPMGLNVKKSQDVIISG